MYLRLFVLAASPFAFAAPTLAATSTDQQLATSSTDPLIYQRSAANDDSGTGTVLQNAASPSTYLAKTTDSSAADTGTSSSIQSLTSGGAAVSTAPTVAVFNLVYSDPASGLSASSFGKVTVVESNGVLTFTETLNPGFRINKGNSNHYALAFSIKGDQTVAVSNLTSGFTFNTSVKSPPYGGFEYGIDCASACGAGYNGGYDGPLSFSITATSGSALTIASLGFNTVDGTPIYLTSDLVNQNGKTGNVGAGAPSVTQVPEPVTWTLLVLGFGMVGSVIRQRPRQAGLVLA